MAAKRVWLRLHFEFDDGDLKLVEVAKMAKPARPSRLPPSPMTLTVVGAAGQAGSIATAQADTCCIAGGATAASRPRYVFEILALPTDQVTLTYSGFGRTYALDALAPAPLPSRPASDPPPEDLAAVQQAYAAGDAWIIVALANGFTADAMGPFVRQVQELERQLKARAPFSHFRDRIRVLPVRTPSPANTLDATSAFGHSEEKLGDNWYRFFVDQDAVARFMRRNGFDETPSNSRDNDRFQPLVVANTTRYGGSGGQAAVFSLAREAVEIAIHEMGHSEFGLSDEYSAAITHPELQPFGPNVQAVTPGQNPFAALKWRARLSPGVALPTLDHPTSVTLPNLPDTPPLLDLRPLVGAFEGGLYRQTGVYRSQLRCAMRGSYEPFCAACSDEISDRLSRLTGLPPP